MNFDEYQRLAKRTDLYPKEKLGELIRKKVFLDITHLIEYRTLCLDGEAGELSNAVQKIRRDDISVFDKTLIEKIKSELGDILWYIVTICEILSIRLNDVAENNILKLADRKNRDKLHGCGDER